MDMLGNAMDACPDELWADQSRQPQFWYVAFHALFFLDLYLTGTDQDFMPPAPFNRDELDPFGLMPPRSYSKDELRAYLTHCRQKGQTAMDVLTVERAGESCLFFGRFQMTFWEFLIYNMRHLQHHVGQLNLILRQATDSAPRWVSGVPRKA